MSSPLRNSAGVIVGTMDAGLPLTLGAWRWIPADAPRIATDTEIVIDAPTMQDVLKGYGRLS